MVSCCQQGARALCQALGLLTPGDLALVNVEIDVDPSSLLHEGRKGYRRHQSAAG